MAAGGIRAWFRAARGDVGSPQGQTGPGAHPTPAPPSAPSPPAEQAAAIHRADYMPPGREAQRFTLAGDGLPTGYLAHRSGQLVLLADGGPEEMVNPRSTLLYRL